MTNASDEAVRLDLSIDVDTPLEPVVIDLDADVVQALQARFGATWKVEAARLLKEAALRLPAAKAKHS